MGNIKDDLCAELSLEIPGLDQKFYLYREQIGRHFTTTDGTDSWYRPTYEAVYFSENVYDSDGEPNFRTTTKLIFESSANVDEQPLKVDEMLSTVPPDMMKYLVDVLSQEWAVVTFGHTLHDAHDETGFLLNFDQSELWQQEESACQAIFQAQDDKRNLSRYTFIRNGRAEPVPGSTLYDWYGPMSKGIFWLIKTQVGEEELITVKVACDYQGKPQEQVTFSSKSGENFNHQAEWDKLSPKTTQGKPYNYFPRGRVEIKNEKITVYCHPDLTQYRYRILITDAFGIPTESHFVADGSAHYEAKENLE